jgi:ubiquinone/menaquinone biosynthesis C-methylase UbiE
MRTKWDYSNLANAYIKRPDYASAAIDAMLAIGGIQKGEKVCDVGAGVAHLTLMLASRGLNVIAVEPNDAMRNIGIKRTDGFTNVSWREGTGENTSQGSQSFDLVTFGSSFNVCDRTEALKEAARILKKRGWFCCMWNHRQLSDSTQAQIEAIIKNHIADYDYGTRREDQVAVIEASGLFGPVVHLDSQVIHEQGVLECVQAWRSHATLERQAGASFDIVVSAIEEYLISLKSPTIRIPYTTNLWIAQLK